MRCYVSVSNRNVFSWLLNVARDKSVVIAEKWDFRCEALSTYLSRKFYTRLPWCSASHGFVSEELILIRVILGQQPVPLRSSTFSGREPPGVSGIGFLRVRCPVCHWTVSVKSLIIIIIIIIRTFVTCTVSANILNLRRRQLLGEEDSGSEV